MSLTVIEIRKKLTFNPKRPCIYCVKTGKKQFPLTKIGTPTQSYLYHKPPKTKQPTKDKPKINSNSYHHPSFIQDCSGQSLAKCPSLPQLKHPPLLPPPNLPPPVTLALVQSLAKCPYPPQL